MKAACAVLTAALLSTTASSADERNITLTLIGSTGETSIKVLNSAVVIAQGEGPCPASGQASETSSSHFDLGVSLDLISDQSFLRWMASPKEAATARLLVGGDAGPVTYTLSGLTTRGVSVAQTSDGDGQMTLTILACHVSVGGIPLN